MGESQILDVGVIEHHLQRLGPLRMLARDALDGLLERVMPPVLLGDRVADDGQITAVAGRRELVRVLPAAVLVQAVFDAIGEPRQALRFVASAQLCVAIDSAHAVQQCASYVL
ncbi:hypothetical protein D3C80_1719410 [compost metagenome]